MIQWRLRQIMADRKITNRVLAERIGIHETSVSNMKRRDDMPRIDGESLDKLCFALDCVPSDLIVYSDADSN
ncbi:MAG: helix-turn-helix transcriptional regulator [Leptolyngbya sp. SIO4C5]|nr:helix-turn-helix transcriptional regulator [Leptolyngbya sp. SIO4C5]